MSALTDVVDDINAYFAEQRANLVSEIVTGEAEVSGYEQPFGDEPDVPNVTQCDDEYQIELQLALIKEGMCPRCDGTFPLDELHPEDFLCGQCEGEWVDELEAENVALSMAAYDMVGE